MTSYAFLPGQGPGLTGLQPQPSDPRRQIQQIVGQVPSAYSSDQIQAQMDYLQRTGSFDGMPTFNDQPQSRPFKELMRRPPPGSTEGGVSSFVGASSNDIQRMLNRGSVATGGVDDAQRQMEQVRTNEFLAKMRAQNPERFNNPTPPSAPSTPPPGVDPGTLPRPPHPFLAEPQQFPFNPFLNKTTPSTAQPSDQGIMGQAPGFMTQYLDMMRSPMQGSMQNPMQSYGGGGMDSNPMLQYQMPPNQSPMQTYGSQNNAPIQSPFA